MSDKPNELPADLQAFIDQLIVPLLVDFFNKRHLYPAEDPRYDDEVVGLAQAA